MRPMETGDTRLHPLPNDSGERKLWLDYLKGLNDRRLQSARNSGLTNYALVALLGAALFWSIQRLPWLLSIPGAVHASMVSFVFAANAVLYCLLSYILLLYYCVGEIENRVRPEPQRRIQNTLLGITSLARMAFTLFQLWAGIRLMFPSRFTKWSVLGFGLWWALNIAYSIAKGAKTLRRALKSKIALPHFTVSEIDPNIPLPLAV